MNHLPPSPLQPPPHTLPRAVETGTPAMEGPSSQVPVPPLTAPHPTIQECRLRDEDTRASLPPEGCGFRGPLWPPSEMGGLKVGSG